MNAKHFILVSLDEDDHRRIKEIQGQEPSIDSPGEALLWALREQTRSGGGGGGGTGGKSRKGGASSDINLEPEVARAAGLKIHIMEKLFFIDVYEAELRELGLEEVDEEQLFNGRLEVELE